MTQDQLRLARIVYHDQFRLKLDAIYIFVSTPFLMWLLFLNYLCEGANASFFMWCLLSGLVYYRNFFQKTNSDIYHFGVISWFGEMIKATQARIFSKL